ncbi:MAG: hypothetical protein EXQ56_08150, partial [Acidobacteria bacterium]|nr:hypothetical protein [Acidobacteriota bacterium]
GVSLALINAGETKLFAMASAPAAPAAPAASPAASAAPAFIAGSLPIFILVVGGVALATAITVKNTGEEVRPTIAIPVVSGSRP